MCTRSNIIGALQALNWAMGALGVILFAFGIILVTKEHWHQAYGDVIGETGGGIIFLSLFMCPLTMIGNYGSKNHNKFMLFNTYSNDGKDRFASAGRLSPEKGANPVPPGRIPPIADPDAVQAATLVKVRNPGKPITSKQRKFTRDPRPGGPLPR